MKAVREVKRKYYKYVESNFVQPILTSNGTMGGDSFACTAVSEYRPAYYMFDGKAEYGGPEWAAYSFAFTGNVWFSFYNPNPIKIYSFTSYFHNNNGYGYNINSGTVYGSNDYNSWDTISTFSGLSGATVTVNVNSTKYYKYYKVHIDRNQGANQVCINQINITAGIQKAEETTQSDYDYYVDIPVYKLHKSVDTPTYYAINN